MNLTETIQSMLEKQFGLSPEQLAPDQVLSELGVESLSMIEFMFELENVFGIEFKHDSPQPRTVADMVAAVAAAISAKESGRA